MTFRHDLLIIHRWIGIALAGFLVLAGATGSLLAFHHEIDAALTPEWHRVAPGPTRASLDEIAARIETKHPRLAVAYFVFTTEEHSSIRAVMNTRAAADAGSLDRDSPRPTEVFADPNLPSVMEPALAAVAPFTERPASVRRPETSRDEVWRVGWDRAYAEGRRVEPVHPVAVIGRIEARGYYQVRFLPPDDIMDAGTIRVFVDGRDGKLLGRFDHREGTVGDKIRIWQFPLHSGQGFGMPGRILICVAGLLPAVLALTGIWLYLRRRRLRHQALSSRAPSLPNPIR